MEIYPKHTDVLNNLGLTNYESKVYVTLLSEGVVSAKNICDVCGIPYGKVYEVINDLSLKGFVHALPTKPRRYRATPHIEALKIIENIHLQKLKEAEIYLKELPVHTFLEKETAQNKTTFLILNGRSAICKKIEHILLTAKKHVKIYTTPNGLKRLMFYSELLQQLQKKGIKINCLINGNNVSPECKKMINILSVPCDIHDHIIAVDGKETILFEPRPDNEDIKFGQDTGVWVVSKSFTSTIENFLEHVAVHAKTGKKLNGSVWNGSQ